MKAKFLILFIATYLFGCQSPSLNKSITNYNLYFSNHKMALDSIATFIGTNYVDTSFNKLSITEIKEVFKKQPSLLIENDVIENLLQIDYYKYGDSLKTVRIYVDIPHNSCTSLSFLKKIYSKGIVCDLSKDNYSLGDCWWLFLIKQSPCYDPFEK